jgi:hypothetical protein
MELKKIRSSGDPVLVMKNRKKINPLLPSLTAVFLQALATAYLYSIGTVERAVISSAILTVVYTIITIILNTKHKKPNCIKC